MQYYPVLSHPTIQHSKQYYLKSVKSREDIELNRQWKELKIHTLFKTSSTFPSLIARLFCMPDLITLCVSISQNQLLFPQFLFPPSVCLFFCLYFLTLTPFYKSVKIHICREVEIIWNVCPPNFLHSLSLYVHMYLFIIAKYQNLPYGVHSVQFWAESSKKGPFYLIKKR